MPKGQRDGIVVQIVQNGMRATKGDGKILLRRATKTKARDLLKATSALSPNEINEQYERIVVNPVIAELD